MKALSIQQPWAWLIAHGIKSIENRKWPTKYRGIFAIHASKTLDREGYSLVMGNLRIPLPDRNKFKYGGIVGVAEIVDCVTYYDSLWFFGPYGFVIRNARTIPFIPMRGQLGFFSINIFNFGSQNESPDLY